MNIIEHYVGYKRCPAEVVPGFYLLSPRRHSYLTSSVVFALAKNIRVVVAGCFPRSLGG